MLLEEMPLEIPGCPLSQCSTTELKTVRQLMQHYRNVHTVRSKKGLPSMYDEEAFDEYLARHGIWRCGKHNSLYATLSSKTERNDGLHRLKYNSCRKCGPSATPVYKLPPKRIFESTNANESEVSASVSPDPASGTAHRVKQEPLIDLTVPDLESTPSTPRILPVLGDLNEPLDSLALTRWSGALSSGKGHLLSKFHLDAGDLSTLRDGRWLSSVVIECFAELLNATEASNKSVQSPGVHMFSVQLYSFLATKQYKYSNVHRWVRGARIDWPSTSHILIPVHVNKNHYVLVDVDKKNARVNMFDSRQRSQWDREKVLTNVRRMVQDALNARDISTWGLKHNISDWELVCEPQMVPQQKDGSCGVYVCGFAACIASSSPFIFDQTDIASMRKRIGLAILDGTPRRWSARRARRTAVIEDNDVTVVPASEYTLSIPKLAETATSIDLKSSPPPTRMRTGSYTTEDIVWFFTKRLPSMSPWLRISGVPIRAYVFNGGVLNTKNALPMPSDDTRQQYRRHTIRVLHRPSRRLPAQIAAPATNTKPKPTPRHIFVPDDPPPLPDPLTRSPILRRRRHQFHRTPPFVISLRRTEEAEKRAHSPAKVQPSPLPALEVIFTTHVPVLSHVPNGARTQVRDALSNILGDFNLANTEHKACDAMTRLFAFAPCLLAAPLGHRRTSTSGKVSLTALVKQRVRLWNGKAYGQLWQAVTQAAVHRSAQRPTPEQQRKSNADRAIRLAKEGAYSRAAQALGSAGVHAASPAVAAELRRKHPQARPTTDGEFVFPPAPELEPLPTHRNFTPAEVMEAVQSFPKAVAAGGSAFSATHLLELLRVPSTRRFGLLDTLTKTVNILASGQAPSSMSQWVGSAPVTPLCKRDGGVRPIAVGETLRRLVGKLWMKRISAKAQAYLGDSQVGVAVKGGAEAVVHAVQRAATDLGNGRNDVAVLQLDLANAFNLVSRRAFLRVVRTEFPELFPWVQYTYGANAPWLWYGDIRWRSATGVQQGDPLGPLLFALALRALMDDLDPKIKQWDKESGGDGVVLRVFYCDDGVFIAKHKILQRILEYFESPLAKSYGFHLRANKCQVWWPSAPSAEDKYGYPSAVVQKYCTGTRVLQAPIGDLASIEAMVMDQVKDAELLLEAIADLPDAHVAFYLLRACFGSCRLAYTLRCVPPEASLRAAQRYDAALEDTLRRLIGGVLSSDVFRELQLPVKSPEPSFGVGLLSAVSCASAAYISSRMSTGKLVHRLLARIVSCHPLDDVHFEGAYRDYANRCIPGDVPSFCEVGSSRFESQKQMVARVHKAVFRSVDKGDQRTQLFRAQLAVPGAKDWLKCAPAPGLRTHIPDRDFRTWFKYWCRVPLFNPGDSCPRSGCNHVLDPYGDHLLGCVRGVAKGNAPLIWRHDALTRLLHSDLVVAKRRPILERRDAVTGKSRPDIQCLGTTGGVDFIELSITNPLPGHANTAKCLLDRPAQILENLVKEKAKQHADVVENAPNSTLVIVPLTTLGGWHKSARKYVKEVIKSSASRLMEEHHFASLTAFARYAARLVAANVHCLMEGSSTV